MLPKYLLLPGLYVFLYVLITMEHTQWNLIASGYILEALMRLMYMYILALNLVFFPPMFIVSQISIPHCGQLINPKGFFNMS